jgi:hypothetical protein
MLCPTSSSRFVPIAVVALVHNSETSSPTLALSCAQNESGNGGLLSGGAPLLGVTPVPEAAAISSTFYSIRSTVARSSRLGVGGTSPKMSA